MNKNSQNQLTMLHLCNYIKFKYNNYYYYVSKLTINMNININEFLSKIEVTLFFMLRQQKKLLLFFKTEYYNARITYRNNK